MPVGPLGAPPPATGGKVVHVIWLNAGLSCDGDSVAFTAAMQPSFEELIQGGLPGVPDVVLHWSFLDNDNGDELLDWWRKAGRGELDPFILILEGSIPNETIKTEGFWSGIGHDPETMQPITSSEWIDLLAPQAWAIMAVGSCACYGGIHGAAGNPTGAMGALDYLGWTWQSKGGVPIVCVPGCPAHPDNMAETLMYLLCQCNDKAPMIPLDEMLRPMWLFDHTVHEGCDRAGYYDEGEYTMEYGTPKCLVRLGCWGPVVKCNVPRRGWIGGVGGCPNVGGICIGCTMPGFPDRFMPFMEEPPYGALVRGLRTLID